MGGKEDELKGRLEEGGREEGEQAMRREEDESSSAFGLLLLSASRHAYIRSES